MSGPCPNVKVLFLEGSAHCDFLSLQSVDYGSAVDPIAQLLVEEFANEIDRGHDRNEPIRVKVNENEVYPRKLPEGASESENDLCPIE